MRQSTALGSDSPEAGAGGTTVYSILLAISISHLLNDTLQSLIPAIYPVVKDSFHLNFGQIGLITLTFQLAASLLQPLVGAFTDRRPQPYSLAAGMVFTLVGLGLVAVVQSYGALLLSVGLVGIGSSIFHPESSRVAHMAAGERRGFAQSFFQVGGNVGSSLGPLFAALIIGERSRSGVLWFMILAATGILLLVRVGRWYAGRLNRAGHAGAGMAALHDPGLSRRRVTATVTILLVLIFSKYFYLASISSYFTFYLIDKFSLTVRSAQLHLFVFQLAVAAGTLIGGPVGDRIGRKYVIWISILGAAPFTLLLPYAGLAGTTILSICVEIGRAHV
jgi:FSR family fosmidomycin resistance protein-like MFS transporter